MRKVAVIALIIMTSVALVTSALAENAVKGECVTLCKDAAKFINEKGLDAAIAEIGNKEGKFVTKNTYVFLMDLEGNRLAHRSLVAGGIGRAKAASNRAHLRLAKQVKQLHVREVLVDLFTRLGGEDGCP